jgi:hypothetical protein
MALGKLPLAQATQLGHAEKKTEATSASVLVFSFRVPSVAAFTAAPE